ncbi:MAG: aspartate aminotransferase family protein [Gemmatimonadota bacterium]
MSGSDPSGLPFGQQLPRIRVRPPGPRSRQLAARLRRVESRNVTYVSDTFPVFWQRAHGANVEDADGNVYLDLSGAFGVASAGHTPVAVTDAVTAQVSLLVHGMGDIHPPALKVDLLERLARLAPWRSARAVLASSGSEAVEIALKTALLATGRTGVLAFEGSYHGLTLGALAVTHREDFRAPFRERLFPGVRFLPFPGGVGGTPVHEAIHAVSAALSGGDDGPPVGAILVEPVQGRGGVRVPPPGFLSHVADLAREHGALVVCDEIFTGLGRTGRMFAFEHEGIQPDLFCVGKALGGGMPLSACLGPRRVMDAWPESAGEALQTSTFLGHPLSCAAALAFLDTLEREGLVRRAREVGAALLAGLRADLADHPAVTDVRGRGLLIGVELATGPDLRPGPEVAEALLRRGVILLPAGPDGRVLELAPPLTISEDQVAFAREILRAEITRA